MAQLSAERIDYIDKDITNRGICFGSLHEDLLDHLCTAVESEMEKGKDFETAYFNTIKLFGPGGLRQVQYQTFIILTKLSETMKKIAFSFGLAATTLLLVGLTFRNLHWPGANITVGLGTILLVFVYLPMLLTHKLKETKGDGKVAIISGFLAMMVFAVAVFFKLLHWPGGTQLLCTSVAIGAFVYAPLVMYSRYKMSVNKSITSTSLALCGSFAVLIFGLFTNDNSRAYKLSLTNIGVELCETAKMLGKRNNELVSMLPLEAEPKARAINKQADEFCSFAEGIKSKLIQKAEGLSESEVKEYHFGRSKKLNDHAVVGQVLLGSGEVGPLKGYSASELHERLDDCTKAINSIYEKGIQDKMLLLTQEEDATYGHLNKEANWEDHYFMNTHLFAAINTLSKFQQDIRQQETQALTYLLAQHSMKQQGVSHVETPD